MPAPTEFTVAQIMGHSDEPWKGKEGPMMTYELRFEGDEQTFKMHVPAEDPAPVAGGAEKGWKNEGGKFGRARPKAPGAGRSGGGGQDSKNFDRRPEHPRNEARMIHTACLGSAPTYYTLLREEGMLDKPEDKAAMLKTLEGIVSWLQNTYGTVLPGEPRVKQMEIPADTNGLSEQTADTTDVPFS